MKQMNIGILQSAGIAGNIIELAFNHPEQNEVFTPIIYSKENNNDKNVSTDLKFGNIKGVVVAPGSATEFNFPGSMIVYCDDRLRLASIIEGKSQEGEQPVELTQELLSERVCKAWQSVRRDFLCGAPRMALLSAGDDAADQDVLLPVIDSLSEQGVYVCGPYDMESFVEEQAYLHFDITLALTEEQARSVLDAVGNVNRTKLISGIPMAMAMTDYSAAFDFDSVELSEPAQALRQAAYTVIDVLANRRAYDEAHQNPLPKIYHERKDDSEKIRFAVKK